MLIDQVFLYFLIAAGVFVSMPALWLLMRARWSQRVEKLRRVSERNMLVSFLAGLPVIGLLVMSTTLLARFGKRGDIPVVAVVALLAVLLAVSALAGLAGLVTLIGERLSSTSGPAEPLKTTLRGGIVMVCIFSMPYVGWFALLPMGIITGGGMMLRSFFVGAPQPLYASVPSLSPNLPPLPSQASVSTV